MEYNWKIQSMYVKNATDLSNVVVKISWIKEGIDTDGSRGSYMNVTTFDLESVNPDEFIPYDELEEAVVIEWIKSQISEEAMQGIDALIQKIADYNKNPEVNVRLPWIPLPAPPTVAE